MSAQPESFVREPVAPVSAMTLTGDEDPVTSRRRVRAVLVAGDGADSRRVAGGSKPFVELAGRAMFLHVLETLLRTPEISEVFVVGDAPRLQAELARSGLLEVYGAEGRAVHVIPQRGTLYENVWASFLASAPTRIPEADREILVVPADVPCAIPEEISQFIVEAQALDVDYVLGLTPDAAMQPFAPGDGRPGIEMACFNLAEGRFRQNNLHLVRPLRILNRRYIDDMYASRYQKELGSMLRLVGRLLRREYRQLWALIPYGLLHVAGMLDRRGMKRAAAYARKWVPLRVVERAASGLLRARFRTVFTVLGGAAVDVDNDADLAVANKMLGPWKAMQTELARQAMLKIQ